MFDTNTDYILHSLQYNYNYFPNFHLSRFLMGFRNSQKQSLFAPFFIEDDHGRRKRATWLELRFVLRKLNI